MNPDDGAKVTPRIKELAARIEALESTAPTSLSALCGELAAAPSPRSVVDQSVSPECPTTVALLINALETIAAQHSGKVGSAARSDCMAALAALALRQYRAALAKVQP